MVISYLSTFLNMVFGLVLSSFLLRRLGDAEYGLYQTVSAFAAYLVMLEFGTGTVMSRNIAVCRSRNEEEKIKKHTATIWYINIFLSILILLVAIIFYFSLGSIYKNTMSLEQIVYGQKIFVFITVYLLASFFTQALNGFLLGCENYTFSQIINVIRLISRTVSLLLIISFIKRAVIIAIIDMIFSIITFGITFAYCKIKYKISFKIKDVDKKILKSALPFCFALMLQTIINQANNSVDKFIIGIKISMGAVSLYSVSQYIYSVFSSVTTLPITMYLPQVAKDIEKGLKGKELANTLIAPCRFVCLIGGLIMCGFFACGKQFVLIIYGQEYEKAWLYALIIIVPMFVNMVNGILINVLDVIGKRIIRSYILLATTVLNIVLTLIFISIFGILGAVFATAISTIIGQIILMNIYYSQALKIPIMYLFKETFKGIFPCQLITALFGFVIGFFIKNTYISFICSGGSFVMLCATFLWLWGLNKKEKEKIKSMLTLKCKNRNKEN